MCLSFYPCRCNQFSADRVQPVGKGTDGTLDTSRRVLSMCVFVLSPKATDESCIALAMCRPGNLLCRNMGVSLFRGPLKMDPSK